MTQYQKIIKLLNEAGSIGINSFDTRSIALQLPARIFYLKRSPYNLKIVSVPAKDNSVNYILQSEIREEPKGHMEFDNKNNVCRWVEDSIKEEKPIEYQQIGFL